MHKSIVFMEDDEHVARRHLGAQVLWYQRDRLACRLKLLAMAQLVRISHHIALYAWCHHTRGRCRVAAWDLRVFCRATSRAHYGVRCALCRRCYSRRLIRSHVQPGVAALGDEISAVKQNYHYIFLQAVF